MSVSRKFRERQRRTEREHAFDLSFSNDRMPEYNPLLDSNLRHHFENPRRQRQLHAMGLIDREGRVIDLDRHKSKLFIIEQEFKHAEDAERRRQREESELRERVRKKRFESLEEQRRLERLRQIKEDRRIRREMLSMTMEARHGPPSREGFSASLDSAMGLGEEEGDFEAGSGGEMGETWVGHDAKGGAGEVHGGGGEEL